MASPGRFFASGAARNTRKRAAPPHPLRGEAMLDKLEPTEGYRSRKLHEMMQYNATHSTNANARQAFVQEMVRDFGAKIVTGSIRPV